MTTVRLVPRASVLERARAGDRAALGTLLEQSRARLERLAGRRVGQRLGARLRVSDVVQSTYVEALRGLDRFDGETEAAFARWLVVVLDNKIKKRGRWFAAAKRDADAAPQDVAVSAPAPQDTPSAALARREEVERVWRALEELPPQPRRLILQRVEGTGIAELARELRTTPASARMLVQRAREALRRKVGDEAIPR